MGKKQDSFATLQKIVRGMTRRGVVGSAGFDGKRISVTAVRKDGRAVRFLTDMNLAVCVVGDGPVEEIVCRDPASACLSFM